MHTRAVAALLALVPFALAACSVEVDGSIDVTSDAAPESADADEATASPDTASDTTADTGADTTPEPTDNAMTDAAAEPTVLDVQMNAITGEPVNLADYKDHAVLIVNVASRCGLTPQYEELQALYEQKKDEGLIILGFPANDFMGQEPGTNAEIAEFCEANYGVSFPMFEKIAVTGDEAHPLFKQLTELSEAPSWNFTKYLIAPGGEFVARFDPRTTPMSGALTGAIDEALATRTN